MADPVSWLMIRTGWDVLAADGTKVGEVDVVAGDDTEDIFDGLAIATSALGKPRYVPAEQVAEITDGRVRLALSKDQVERLGEFEEPPTTAEILPEEAGTLRRAEAAVEAPIHSHEERLNILTRMRHTLRRLLRR